jgi:hypothetical protein
MKSESAAYIREIDCRAELCRELVAMRNRLAITRASMDRSWKLVREAQRLLDSLDASQAAKPRDPPSNHR